MSVPQPAPATRRPSAERLARTLRRLAGDGVAATFSAPLALLLSRTLRFDAADPLWPDRDRLLVGSGQAELVRHAAGLLGVVAAQGFFDVAAEPVGLGAGAALGERMLAARFGRSLVDHRSWVLADAAQLATGAVQEAACLAGLWRLGRLAVIACEPGEADTGPPLGAAGFAAFGWTVRRVAAGDAANLDGALSAALRSFKPTLVLVAPGHAVWPETADPAGEDEAWQVAARRGAGMRRSWLKRLARHAGRAELEATLAGRLPAGWHARLADPPWLPAAGRAMSTAQATRLAMADIAAGLPALALLPGDADWPPSPGIAEPAWRGGGALTLGGSTALAGLALHGGVLPVLARRATSAQPGSPSGGGATARSRALTILVEASGQSSGMLAGLRATADLLVLRPADAAEALECLELALRHAGGPSVLMVCEQAVAGFAERPGRTRAARGGHLVAGTSGPRAATLVASGPELHVALAARVLLQAAGLAVAVVSLPCWTLFAAQDAGWRAQVLGMAPLVGLETSGGFGWERWLGQGLFISLLPDPGAAPASPEGQACMVARMVERHLRGLAGASLPATEALWTRTARS